MALIIRPGRHKKVGGDHDSVKKSNAEPVSTLDAILDIIRLEFLEKKKFCVSS